MEKMYNDKVVFKDKISKLEIIRTLIAMTNTKGGVIQIERGKDFELHNLDSFLKLLEQYSSNIFYKNYDNYKVNSFVIRRRCAFFYTRNGEQQYDYFNVIVKNLRDGAGVKEEPLMYYLNEKDEKEYYFRVRGRNIKTNEIDAHYLEKVAIYDAPIHNSYQPTDSRIKEYLEQKHLVVEAIGDFTRKPYLYKYLDLEASLLSLNNGSIRFVEPTNWDDQYEGRFYTANFYNGSNSITVDSNPFLYACCFSTKPENEAAWVLYSHDKPGLASRCVQFKLNRKKLFDQIIQFALLNSNISSVFFGLVHYENKFEIDNVHKSTKNKKDNPFYHKYFDHFCLNCYLNLLLLKRNAFEHEQELRIFLVPDKGNSKTRKKSDGTFIRDGKRGKKIKPLPITIDIDWLDVVEEVRIDKKCSNYEKGLLNEAIEDLIDKSITNPVINAALKIKLKPKDFDPYEDVSLRKAPLKISTN